MAGGTERAKSYMATGAYVGCIKILLTVYNFVFWITGIAVLVLGIWIVAGLQKYTELLDGYPSAATWAIIGTGAAIVIIASFACYCTFKGYGRLLYIYAAFLMVVFLAELAAGATFLVFKGQVQTSLKTGMNNTMKSYTDGSDSAMDKVQQSIKCCGIKSYVDWYYVSYGNDPKNPNTVKVPKSCCVTSNNCTNTNLPLNLNQTTASIYVEGCHLKIVSGMEGNIAIIGSAVLGFSFLQLLGSVLACCLGKGINKAKYEQVA